MTKPQHSEAKRVGSQCPRVQGNIRPSIYAGLSSQHPGGRGSRKFWASLDYQATLSQKAKKKVPEGCLLQVVRRYLLSRWRELLPGGEVLNVQWCNRCPPGELTPECQHSRQNAEFQFRFMLQEALNPNDQVPRSPQSGTAISIYLSKKYMCFRMGTQSLWHFVTEVWKITFHCML